MMGRLAAMQKQVLANSEHVGDRFPAEARAIHLGEAEARAIHGRATAGRGEEPGGGGRAGLAFAVSGAGARQRELTAPPPRA